MLIHIVRLNETVEDILRTYNITFDELRVNNLHITDFNKIPGGVKIKIPFLNKECLQVLESTESFISDYYPSISKLDELNEIKNQTTIDEGIDENRFNDILEKNNILEEVSEEKIEEKDITSNQNNLVDNSDEEVTSTKDNNSTTSNKQQLNYVRPTYELPIYNYRKSIYPHYSVKDKKEIK